ncbi:hypothetical protein BH11PSE2_BH11PSE2_13200 [soil metagenome]
MNRIVIAAIAAIAIAAPAASFAQNITLKVNLDGVNLTTVDGAKTALKRISQAADKACSTTETGSRIPTVDAACKRTMTHVAVVSLDAPMVTAMHDFGGPIQLASRSQLRGS